MTGFDRKSEVTVRSMSQHQQMSSSLRQTNPVGLPEILTAKELEALLRIDVKTIYGYVQRGLIPYVRIQSNLRFRKQEVLDWLASQSYSPHSNVHRRQR